MRISTASQYDAYSSGISSAYDAMFEAQKRVSTGQRLNRPSEDAFGTTSAISMRRLRSGVEQYEKNLQTAKGQLGYTEVALSEISTLMAKAYELSVRAANDTLGPEARAAMATEARSLQERLLSLANSQGPNGEYLFAGQRSDVKPYTISGGALSFAGDTQPLLIEAGPGEWLNAAIAGEPLIGEAYARLDAFVAALDANQTQAIADVHLGQLQNSLRQVDSQRGQLGARLQNIDNYRAQMGRRKEELTLRISEIEEVDLSQAITEYQKAQAAYQAALTVASQGFRLSLMDYLQG